MEEVDGSNPSRSTKSFQTTVPHPPQTADAVHCKRLMPAIVLILKFLETDQIIGQHCSITRRKAVVI